MIRTTNVRTQPKALTIARHHQPGSRVVNQCLTIPDWDRVKHTNTPTEYSGIRAWVSPLNRTSRPKAIAGQQDDPPRVGQPVAPEAELAGHVAVLGEDRGQPRERVEAGVGGQEQDQGRRDLEQVEERARAEDGPRDEGHHCRAAAVVDRGHDREGVGDDRDPDEDDSQQDRHRDHRVGGVLRLGLLERRHAVGDRLHPGQGDRAAGERLEQQEDAELLGGPQGHRVGLRAAGRGPCRSTIRKTPPTTISRARPTNR